jgi:hypothetical protein
MFLKSKEKFYKENKIFNILNLNKILNTGFLAFIFILISGYVVLYSITESFKPWAYKHIIYTLICLPIFLFIVILVLD